MGVVGWVREKGSDKPVPNVTIQVTGEDDDDDFAFDGPFLGVTTTDGNYNIYIGPIDDVGERKFQAQVMGGPEVISEDKPEWETAKDCHDSTKIQVIRIEWGQKNN